MIKKLLAVGTSVILAAGISACAGLTAEQPAKLDLQVYNPQQESMFPVTSTLITGPSEAVLFDAQFQKNDAEKLVELIQESGKNLTTIYISHGDPDYYFGLDVLHKAFPQAKIVATPATVKKIAKSMQGKKAYWGPILKENAPKKLLLPQALRSDQLLVDGEEINIIGFKGHDPLHTFAWIPSEKTVLGGVVLFENMHLWVADNKTSASRDAWLKTLENMKALQPNRVIAGHFLGQSTQDTRIIDFTRSYIQAFENAAEASDNSQGLITKIKNHYPELPSVDTLEFSAKVVKGDIKWPK